MGNNQVPFCRDHGSNQWATHSILACCARVAALPDVIQEADHARQGRLSKGKVNFKGKVKDSIPCP